MTSLTTGPGKLKKKKTLSNIFTRPFIHEAMSYGQKRFKLVWRCYQLLSGFLAKGHLPRVSRQARRSLMIRLIMKWPRGLCTDLSICFRAEENPGKSQLGDSLMKELCLNGVLFLQMTSVTSHRQKLKFIWRRISVLLTMFDTIWQIYQILTLCLIQFDKVFIT